MFDTLGNRTNTLAGGDATGGNLRPSTYLANNLNQVTQRGVPGAANQIGAAYADANVTVNNSSAHRKGEDYQHALALANGSAPVWQVATNKAVKGTNTVAITHNLLCAPTTQTFTYDLDANLTNDLGWALKWCEPWTKTLLTRLWAMVWAA